MDRPGVNAYDLYQKELLTQAMRVREKTFTKLGHDIVSLCNKATGNVESKIIDFKSDIKEWLDSESQSVLVNVCLFDGGTKLLDIPIKIDKCESYALPEVDVVQSKIKELVTDPSVGESIAKKTEERMKGITERLEREKKEYWDRVNASAPKTAEVKKEENFNNDAATVFEVNRASYPSTWQKGTEVPISGVTYVITDDSNPLLWTLTRSDLVSKEEKK